MNLLREVSFYAVFFGAVFLVWAYRTFRLLVTLFKTPRLKPDSKPSESPTVSVVIPAKNEENNIRECLEHFQRQTYRPYEVIVINDNSSDKTEKILQSLNAVYINCPLPPEGWTGKNHAIYCGVKETKGEWLLFTDADTRHTPESISSAIAYAEKNRLELLSLLPHCLTGSFIEEILQPPAMAYLGLWFPFDQVNDPQSPLFFANGQYLLIKRGLYERLGGHKAVAGAFLEDFALMDLAKKSGARARCGFGTEIYGTRMYDSWDSIWKGWRRIYLHAFQSRPQPLIQNAFSLLLFSVFPFLLLFPVLFLEDNRVKIFAFLTAAIIFVVASQAHRMVRTKPFFAFFHPFAALVILLILFDAAGMAIFKKKTVWR